MDVLVRGELERRGNTPQQRLLAVFDVLGDWFRQKEFRGCLFINAASEYCGLDKSIGDLAARTKRQFREQLHKLAEASGVKRPAHLADQLSLLIEGAIVMSLMEKSPEWASTAKEAARVLIKSALPSGNNAATK